MPIAELGYCNFSNSAAKYRFFSQGQISVPIVFVLANGGKAVYGGVGSGACHSQCSEGWFQNVPRIKRTSLRLPWPRWMRDVDLAPEEQ